MVNSSLRTLFHIFGREGMYIIVMTCALSQDVRVRV